MRRTFATLLAFGSVAVSMLAISSPALARHHHWHHRHHHHGGIVVRL